MDSVVRRRCAGTGPPPSGRRHDGPGRGRRRSGADAIAPA